MRGCTFARSIVVNCFAKLKLTDMTEAHTDLPDPWNLKSFSEF
jgi:hypothetical protein